MECPFPSSRARAGASAPCSPRSRPLPKGLQVGIGENSPSMFGPAVRPAEGQAGAPGRLLQRDDLRRRQLPRVRAYQLEPAQLAGSARSSRSSTRPATRAVQADTGGRPVPAALARGVRAEPAAVPGRLPGVREIVPWNEINHFTQPTARNPGREVHHDRPQGVHGLHRGGRRHPRPGQQPERQAPEVRVDDPLHQALPPRVQGPRNVCGVHNYSDVNRFRKSGTNALVKALGCKQIWLTEAGGIFSFPGFSPSAARQLKATKYLFKVAAASSASSACTSTTTSAGSRRASMPASWPAACRGPRSLELVSRFQAPAGRQAQARPQAQVARR